jgi:type IV pilus assembly protein PilQ
MKNIIYILLLLCLNFSFAQNDNQRIETIKNQLTLLANDNAGLTENLKTEVSVTNITLYNFLLALAEVHKLNINVSQQLNQTSISPKFPNVIVTDLLVFLCKEYSLTIEFTGNILSIKPYIEKLEEPKKREIPISYTPSNNLISLDIKGDKLYDVFRHIMDETGKNLVFSPDIQNKDLTVYIKDTPFDVAMNKLAYSNLLYVEQTKDGFFKFEDDSASSISTQNNPNSNQTTSTVQRPARRRSSNFFFKIKDKELQLLEVDFKNTSIEAVINDIGDELDIDVFTATPLSDAGIASFKAKSISFDQLLVKLFESQSNAVVIEQGNAQQRSQPNQSSNPNTNFTFKKENNIYYFGTENQLSVRSVEIVHLLHRSIDLLTDPSGVGNSRSAGRNNFNNNTNFNSGSFNNTQTQRSNNNNGNNQFDRNNNFSSGDQSQDFIDTLVPDELSSSLAIKVDKELNSFYVVGS